MKKTLILASVLVFSTAAVFAAQVPSAVNSKQPQAVECKKPPMKPDMKRVNQFEQRLKLSDIQKQKAKEIRMKGHEEMKPIMEAIRDKKKEIEAVKLSRMSTQAQEEKISELRAEIQDLKKQAGELRKKNMQEFEAILTRTQKKELEKMKQEGRRNFDKQFKKHHGDFKGPRCNKPGFPPPPVYETQPVPPVKK